MESGKCGDAGRSMCSVSIAVNSGAIDLEAGSVEVPISPIGILNICSEVAMVSSSADGAAVEISLGISSLLSYELLLLLEEVAIALSLVPFFLHTPSLQK